MLLVITVWGCYVIVLAVETICRTTSSNFSILVKLEIAVDYIFIIHKVTRRLSETNNSCQMELG